MIELGHSTHLKADSMKKILVTILACVVVTAVGGLAFIFSGIYDVSATTPDNTFVAWVVHKVSDTSVGARLGANHPPVGLDKPEKIMAGGRLFFGELRCLPWRSGPCANGDCQGAESRTA